MTEDRDFKRLVRQRMAATGDTYTAARAALRAPTGQSEEAPQSDDTAGTIADFRRLYTRTALDRLPEHLGSMYGLRPRWSVELDVGVLRIEFEAAPSWIARVFPPQRPVEAVAREAQVLRRLEASGFPAERCPEGVDPVSVLDDQPVLITESLSGADGRGEASETTAHSLGALLGQLHAMPLDDFDELGLTAAGAWHHLSVGGGGRREDVAALIGLLAAADGRRTSTLVRSLESLDDGSDLPSALIHPDPCGANAIIETDGTPVLIDWTGVGRGPRLLSFANLVMGAHNLASADAAAEGYRQSIELTSDELDRLPALLVGFPTILACWSHLFQGTSLNEALAQLAVAENRAAVIAERIRRAFSTPRRNERHKADVPPAPTLF